MQRTIKNRIINTLWCLRHPVVTIVASSIKLSHTYPDVAEKWFDNPTAYMRTL